MKRITPSLTGCLMAAIFFAGCKKDSITDIPPVVNAGPSQTIKMPVDSVRLTGTATDVDSRVVAYLWSEVSGPNVPEIADNGSASTEVNGLIGGTYLFQLMAVDSLGLTGVDTLTVTVIPSGVITLAPVNNPFEFDYLGYTADNSDGSPGETTPELGAEAWTIGGAPCLVRGALGFDLSSLPANTPIISASLTLYSDPAPLTGNLSTPNAGTTNAMYIRRINSSWNPGTSLWATQPTTDTAGQVLIPQTNLSSLDLVGIDVTALVRKMIASGNYGFMIQLQTEVIYNSRIFCSSKYSDQTRRPRLVITY